VAISLRGKGVGGGACPFGAPTSAVKDSQNGEREREWLHVARPLAFNRVWTSSQSRALIGNALPCSHIYYGDEERSQSQTQRDAITWRPIAGR